MLGPKLALRESKLAKNELPLPSISKLNTLSSGITTGLALRLWGAIGVIASHRRPDRRRDRQGAFVERDPGTCPSVDDFERDHASVDLDAGVEPAFAEYS